MNGIFNTKREEVSNLKIFALVITHNRKKSLELCLSRLLNQKRAPDRILIINNASTDGTTEYLEGFKNTCTVVNMERNTGASGAYNFGLKWCVQNGADWIWVVEDDTIVPKDFSLKLLDWIKTALRTEKKIGFVFPRILSVYDRRVMDHRVQFKVPERMFHGGFEISKSQFLGLTVNAAAIKEVGLPVKEFFIYNDDFEFTHRMSYAGWKGFWIPDLFAWHYDKPKPRGKGYITCGKEECWKYFYGIRNELSVTKREAPHYYPRQLLWSAFVIPVEILLRRPHNKFSVAFQWSVWSLKSLFFKYQIEKA
jgi:rhamnopyranosyl-N-acetylglucosaminyl-diphospho-decaprenol beta-1,3/1,4-galactofuranosyltransferase